jgi:hypothetical protein
MLGLNVEALAVADYEIISRMEALVQGQHVNMLSAPPPQNAVNYRNCFVKRISPFTF